MNGVPKSENDFLVFLPTTSSVLTPSLPTSSLIFDDLLSTKNTTFNSFAASLVRVTPFISVFLSSCATLGSISWAMAPPAPPRYGEPESTIEPSTFSEELEEETVDRGPSNTEKEEAFMAEISRYITQASASVQSLLGLAQIFMAGDIYSGLYGTLLGILGVSGSRAGRGPEWLKTYVVISFINGSVQLLELLQQLLAPGNFLLVLAPHIILLASPAASFAGAYFGWQYICFLRKTASTSASLSAQQILAWQAAMTYQQQQMQLVHLLRQQQQNQVNLQQPLVTIKEEEEEDESKTKENDLNLMSSSGG